jgi:hypothetical protein
MGAAPAPPIDDILAVCGLSTLGKEPPLEAVEAVLDNLRVAAATETPIRRAAIRAGAVQALGVAGLADPGELVGAALGSAPVPPGPPAPPLVRSLAAILADPRALEPPVAVVPRLAWRGRVTLLAAREKAGKSTMAGAAGAAVSRGASWLGEPTTAGPVLLIALEEHVSDAAARLSEWGAGPERTWIVDSLATAGDPLAAIRAAVVEIAPALLVVDTLAALVEHVAARPDPGSSTAWTPIMAALTRTARETDAAVLLLHHARKSDGAYRDSTAIGAGVDAIMTMSEDGQDADVRRLAVRARWRVADYAVRLAGTRYELAAGELSLDARVLLRVEGHPGSSMRGVCEGVSARTEEITAAVRRLLSRGAIEDRGSGAKMALYAATPPEAGKHSGKHPVSGEKPQGNATETLSGNTLFPDSKPLVSASGNTPPDDLFPVPAEAA